MRLSDHPEYTRYVLAQQTDALCRAALAAWTSEDEAFWSEGAGQCWTPAGALGFVQSLSRLFGECNRVLWEAFPYCRTCYGQCCVLDATRVTATDCIALALLDRPFPTLPARVGVTDRECVYHTPAGCVWPAEWRPPKCWLFYCALGEPTGDIVVALQGVISRLLPPPLRQYEAISGDSLADHAGDPVDLARAFETALLAVFTTPFEARYSPALSLHTAVQARAARSATEPFSPPRANGLVAFIREASVRLATPAIAADLGPLGEQFLADLSLLECAAAARSGRADDLLRDIGDRYERVPLGGLGEAADLWRGMRDQVRALREAARPTSQARNQE